MPTDSFDLTGLAMAQHALAKAPFLRDVAVWLANWGITVVPMMLTVMWLMQRGETRRSSIAAALAGVAALAIAGLLSFVFYEPRPFAVSLSPNFLAHVADSSFPSEQSTLMTTVAVSLAMSQHRSAGLLVAIIGIGVAVSRIALGVHFPIDIVAGLLLGTGVAMSFRLQPAAGFVHFVGDLAELLRSALRLDMLTVHLARCFGREWAR